ncbi:MAG: hypothetical protein WC802_01895 [Patescibacteria group bacterium]
MKEHPETDVLVTGGTARDAVLGRTPRGIHLVVHGMPEVMLTEYKKYRNIPQDLDIRLPASNIWHASDRRLEETRHHTLPINHDLARRDATINAMAYSIRDGVMHDPFDGLRDIEERTLRTIGKPEDRFHEDPIRMARFLRLASELGFRVADDAWQAITSHGHHLNRTSSDEAGHARYHIARAELGREVVDALTRAPKEALKHFWDSGVIEHLAPELHKLKDLAHQHNIPGLDHATTILEDLADHGASSSVIMAAMFALFEDESKKVFERTLERLHLPLLAEGSAMMADIPFLLKYRNILEEQSPDEMSPAQFEHIFEEKRGDDLLLFLHALAVTGGRKSLTRERWYLAKRRKESLSATPDESLVRGRDLLSLGLSPGPHLRQLLEKIRNEQLSGRVHTKADALEFARSAI